MAYPAGKVRGIERWKLERKIPRGVLSCFHLPYTNHIGLKSFSRQIDQNVPPECGIIQSAIERYSDFIESRSEVSLMGHDTIENVS